MQNTNAFVTTEKNRPRRSSPGLLIEAMEARRLLSVSAATPLPAVSVVQAAAPTTVSLAPAFTETTQGVQLTFSAVSDNPALVTPSVSGSKLTLQFNPALSGVSNVTATATEPGGHSASQIFLVTVTAQTNVTVGVGGVNLVHFSISADATHRAGSGILFLAGGGTAVVHFAGNLITHTAGTATRVSGDGDIAGITITGSTVATLLSLSTGYARSINLGDVTADASLGRLVARNVTLVGNMTIKGGIGAMALGSAANDQLTLGSDPAAFGQLTIGSLTNTTITAGSTLNLLQSATIQSSTINVTGDLRRLNVAPPKGTVAISGLNLTASGSIIQINVRGDIVNSVIHAGGNIHLLSALSMTASQIYCGIASLAAGQTLPTSTDFVAPTFIDQIVLKGDGATPAFSNSMIASSRIRSATIRSIAGANNGSTFGLAAQAISSVSGSVDGRAFRLAHLKAGVDTNALLLAQGVTPGDFVVDLL